MILVKCDPGNNKNKKTHAIGTGTLVIILCTLICLFVVNCTARLHLVAFSVVFCFAY